jgi:hypothetical protein
MFCCWRQTQGGFHYLLMSKFKFRMQMWNCESLGNYLFFAFPQCSYSRYISCTRDNFTLHLFVDFNSAILERVFLVVWKPYWEGSSSLLQSYLKQECMVHKY